MDGVFCVALNSNLYYDPSGAPDLYEQQAAWLDSVLAEARQSNPAHILIFMHHPLFIMYVCAGDIFMFARETDSSARQSNLVHILIFMHHPLFIKCVCVFARETKSSQGRAERFLAVEIILPGSMQTARQDCAIAVPSLRSFDAPPVPCAYPSALFARSLGCLRARCPC